LSLVLLLMPCAQAAPAAPSVLVQSAPATLRSLDEQLTVYGKVEADPERLRALTTLSSGEVRKLYVGLGQRVAVGQPLLELATAPQARMVWTQARGRVDSARIQLQQTQDLFNEQLATRADLANARQALSNATAELAALRAQGAQHVTQVLRAAEAAVVTQLDAAPGALVQPGQPLLMLGALGHVWVRLGLEPEDAARIVSGMPVTLTPVFGGAPLAARIAQVHAVINPATHLVDAVVKLEGGAAAAQIPGAWMRGVIRLRAARVLAVPRSAVLDDAQGHYVFVIERGHARRVAAHVGLEQDGWVAVQGALAPGAQVVSAGNYELSDGMAVRIASGGAR
jgi:RND family efflux transporter MFP subunit